MEKRYLIRDSLSQAMRETHLSINAIAKASGISRADLMALKLGSRTADADEISKLEAAGLHITPYCVPVVDHKPTKNEQVLTQALTVWDKILGAIGRK